MGERDFFRDDSKRRVTAAIQALESRSSAELVVSAQHTSSVYLDADYLVGFALAVVVLVVMLFTPPEFEDWSFVPAVLLAFVAGVALSSQVAPLRRLLTPKARRDRAVHAAACAAFMKLGIARTKRRSGILVFLSSYERRAEVIADIGIDPAKLGEPYRAGIAAIEAAAERLDLDAFISAVGVLGAALAAAMPRGADDANELPDDVDAA